MTPEIHLPRHCLPAPGRKNLEGFSEAGRFLALVLFAAVLGVAIWMVICTPAKTSWPNSDLPLVAGRLLAPGGANV